MLTLGQFDPVALIALLNVLLCFFSFFNCGGKECEIHPSAMIWKKIVIFVTRSRVNKLWNSSIDHVEKKRQICDWMQEKNDKFRHSVKGKIPYKICGSDNQKTLIFFSLPIMVMGKHRKIHLPSVMGKIRRFFSWMWGKNPEFRKSVVRRTVQFTK